MTAFIFTHAPDFSLSSWIVRQIITENVPRNHTNEYEKRQILSRTVSDRLPKTAAARTLDAHAIADFHFAAGLRRQLLLTAISTRDNRATGGAALTAA